MAILRTEAGRDPRDRDLHDLVGGLSTRSNDFRRRWSTHDVRYHGAGIKQYRHRDVGDLELAYESVDMISDPGPLGRAGADGSPRLRPCSAARPPGRHAHPDRDASPAQTARKERVMLTYDFSGQAAFVTGASAGMGASAARAFAAAGAAVAIVDLDGEAAQGFAEQLRADGQGALGIRCDVSDEEQIADAVAATLDAFGRLDVAFNNAGIMLPPVDSADEPAEAFDQLVAVNRRGVWASMKHELCCLSYVRSGRATSSRSRRAPG